MSLRRFLFSLVAVSAGSAMVAACSSAPEENPAQTREAVGTTCTMPGCRAVLGCADNPTCATWPANTSSGACSALADFGCQPAFSYRKASGPVEPAALCPGVPPQTSALPCDECTGLPPKGWTFVTWSLANDPCTSPSHGCTHISCAGQ